MIFAKLPEHITQSEPWSRFKGSVGSPSYKAGGVYFTLHKIPPLNKYLAYAPKVNPEKIDFNAVSKTAGNLGACAIRFDVPNVVEKAFLEKEEVNKKSAKAIRKFEKYCRKAPKNTFSKYNVLLDLSPSEDTLFRNLKPKTRYNTRLATRKGVVVEKSDDIDLFIKLQKETAKRQRFYVHPDNYYRKMYEALKNRGIARILSAKHKREILAMWVLINHQNTLYYIYGGSSGKHRNLMASNLLMWESIKLGKNLGCGMFDMWGATNDRNSPWWGFTKFKLGYGGTLVKYIDSYDMVLNKPAYRFFNTSYGIFWFLLNVKKSFGRLS